MKIELTSVHLLLKAQGITLYNLGKMDSGDLQILRNNFPDVLVEHGYGNVTDEHRSFANNNYDVNLDELCPNGTFSHLSSFGKVTRLDAVTPIIDKYVDNVQGLPCTLMGCSSIYAPVHNDSSYLDRESQIMFVTDNDARHKLHSKLYGNDYAFTAEAGDILYLNAHVDHAVFPDLFKGLEFAINNPFKFIAVCSNG